MVMGTPRDPTILPTLGPEKEIKFIHYSKYSRDPMSGR